MISGSPIFMLDRTQVERAIEMGVYYIKPWDGKVRCFDHKRGYGDYVDLTEEEYKLFLEMSNMMPSEALR